MGPSEPLRAAHVAIDLAALSRNLERLASLGSPIRAVVKADAYGHGAVRVAQSLAASGVERFAVALVEEGIELRRAGIEGDILIMGPADASLRALVEEHSLAPVLSSPSQLSAWLESSGDPVRVHLKVNTGMNRLGLPAGDLAEAVERVRASPGLRLAGLMTHFDAADEPESGRTSEQRAQFADTLRFLGSDGEGGLEIHCANSAAMLHHAADEDESCRPGLALFGYDPAGRRTDLEPVMSVHARVIQVHDLATGESVGYGGRWRAGQPSRIGTVPVGYADGYTWRLGGRSEALLAGRRVPVVGAVSMDMLAIDITGTGATEGDPIVLLGRQGSTQIDATELADRAGTSVYEILCGFGGRLQKVYQSTATEPAADR